MEPIFIYFDKVPFDNSSNSKTFTLTFSDGDVLDGVFFRKTKDYYLTSMSSSITIEQNIKELNDYDDIKKISDISKVYFTNGIDHYQTFPLISSAIFSGIAPNKRLMSDKSKRGLSLVRIDYFDVDSKTTSFVYAYSGYEDLRLNGLKFTNEDVSLKLDLVKEQNELYIEKKVSLIKSNDDLFKDAIDEANSENVIMVKSGTNFFPVYIPIAKYYFKRKAVIPKRQFQWEIRTHPFIFIAMFDRFRYNYVITRNKSEQSSRFPIWVGKRNFTIAANENIYVTPSLYQKLKRKLTFSGKIRLNDFQLQDIKTKLANTKFNKSVFYVFTNRDSNATWTFSINDFTIPNTNININIKSKQDIFNYSSEKKIDISEKKVDMSEKVKAPQDLIQRLQSKELNLIQSLLKKVNLKSLTVAYENFFLYDLENMIKPTFTTELQKHFYIYGLIYFFGKQKGKLHLIRPKSKLKFRLVKDIYKKQMKFEIAKVHKKKTFNVDGDYIWNLSILTTEKTGIGQKRKMELEIVNEIPILGIQNSEFNVLNPIYISINSDDIISRLRLYKNNKFRFVLNNLVFSSNLTNQTDVIIVAVNGLADAKQALIIKNNKPTLESTLGICFLNEIPEWKIIKSASKRVQVVFSDSENLNQNSDHLAFSFITKNITDLLQFSITLLDGAGKKITFPANETKLPIVNFTIQILK